MERIKIMKGDITRINADAIVNAANTSLLGGGGVDGAIHAAAGPGLLEECKTLNGCETGDAKITNGYNLPAKFIIHTVGPVWKDGFRNEDYFLKSSYESCLAIARNYNLETLAFPNISTGVYGFPKKRAANIAFQTVSNFLRQYDMPVNVLFIIYDEENLTIYKNLTENSDENQAGK